MTVTDDQGRSVAYNLGTGTTSINLPPREVRSLNFRIDAVNTQSAVGVGLTEVALFDSNSMRLDLAERLVMPTVPDLDGAGDAARYLMERSMMGAPLVEEPNLVAVHGEPYRRWAAATGRFVPGLGRGV